MSMSKIKTFEAACKYLKLDPVNVLPGLQGIPQQHQESTTAYVKLVIVAEALNKEANGREQWKPDWTNDDEWKYYPWFDLSSGSGLSFNDYGDRDSTSYVGSRLCFKTAELAKYAGKQFLKLYEQYFLLK